VSIGFILNQTTRSLKDRVSLLKSRRGQGHMSNFSQERVNSSVKSLLLQVDQALGSSQCLLMGTLANFTLSKRREILEKSSVNEILTSFSSFW
jgi:hypothetical protein